jgi:hypothetical protein
MRTRITFFALALVIGSLVPALMSARTVEIAGTLTTLYGTMRPGGGA